MIDVERLQERLDFLGLNPFSASRQAGFTPGYVRDLIRGKVKEPSYLKLKSLARVLRCSPEYLLGEADEPGAPPSVDESPTSSDDRKPDVQMLPVLGEVSAGAWMTMDTLPDEPLGWMPAPRWLLHRGRQEWYEHVRGRSVDLLGIPDGSLIHVVDTRDRGYTPRSGDIVVVTRTRRQAGIQERSVKQVEIGPEGEVQLWGRSSDPRFNGLLSYTAGATGDEEDLTVEVVGRVVASYQSFEGKIVV